MGSLAAPMTTQVGGHMPSAGSGAGMLAVGDRDRKGFGGLGGVVLKPVQSGERGAREGSRVGSMDELAKLQLVSKVCGRLDEELGVGDRTLAEFVIHLAETQGTPSAFGAALAENGADFPALPPAARAATQLHAIYAGRVTKVAEFGAFVALEGPTPPREGLVHVSMISGDGARDAARAVARDQRVFVKVLGVAGSRVSLSMRDAPRRAPGGGVASNPMINPGVSLGDLRRAEAADAAAGGGGRRRKRLTSPELWEARQLAASGVVPAEMLPTFDEEGVLGDFGAEEAEEARDRAQRARAAGALAKERRELKQAQANALIDGIPKDLNRPWEDPMPDAGERHFAQELRSVNLASSQVDSAWKRQQQKQQLSFGHVSNKSLREQRAALPSPRSNRARGGVAAHQVLVVIGETGSGKTTQMTQSWCELGAEVGYSIRFEDCTSPATVLKYMTDGMLMREYLADNDLGRYAALILDEAHERTIHTDVLFGLLKDLLGRRPDLKLVVTSATLDAEKFSAYFFDCPIFTIPGRLFPVEVLYTKEPEADYLDAALITVMQIHLSEPAGDVLVFLTGQEEIDSCCEILHARMEALGGLAPELLILPVYGALPAEMQSRIFEPPPPGARKCVVATNIAEASLTIDGIYYVALGALDDEGLLTRFGRKMAEFPLEPQLSKMLIAAADLGCAEEVLSVVAMLSVEQPFYRPRRSRPRRTKKAKFFQPEGDHLMLLAVYDAWKRANFSNPWCYENFLQARAMRRAADVRKQIVSIMDRYKMDVLSAGRKLDQVYIHPSSALFNKNPVASTTGLVLTSKYARQVMAVEPRWLVELAPRFTAPAERARKAKRSQKIEPDRPTPGSWRLSKRRGYLDRVRRGAWAATWAMLTSS
ncbi:helicase [Aureococcus anophagefferens]|nr:helicase [Aureococcus anophagefferens]